MKDLGATWYIFGMEIKRDRSNNKILLSKSKYVNALLERFNMTAWRWLVVPILQGTKISMENCPKSPSEMEYMTKVPYISVVGTSLMYAMVCMRLDIAQVVGVLSCFMAKLRQVHWDAVKSVRVLLSMPYFFMVILLSTLTFSLYSWVCGF